MKRYLLWRDRGKHGYCYLANSDDPSIGYHDDDCRSCPVELAEQAPAMKIEIENLEIEIERLKSLLQDKVQDHQIKQNESTAEVLRLLTVENERLTKRVTELESNLDQNNRK